MILTVDIGNSYITIGGYIESKLIFVSDVVTDQYRTSDQYAIDLLNLMRLKEVETGNITGAILSSVVPELTETIRDAIHTLTGITALAVGPGVKSGLNIRIDNPAQLGADTVACAVAALEYYEPPCIICDLGTATVLSVIDREKRFLGVIIAAGIGTTQDIFTRRTALLPHVNIEKPKKLIGKNTINSVQSGLINGTASMIDGLILRIERELNCEAKIIATGKMTEKVIPFCDRSIEIRDYLLLDGLRLIYERNTQ